jgi:hypothetical protein
MEANELAAATELSGAALHENNQAGKQCFQAETDIVLRQTDIVSSQTETGLRRTEIDSS